MEIESERVIEGRYVSYYMESDGILHHLSCIYVPPSERLHTLILIETHRVPYSTHLGVKKMHINL